MMSIMDYVSLEFYYRGIKYNFILGIPCLQNWDSDYFQNLPRIMDYSDPPNRASQIPSEMRIPGRDTQNTDSYTDKRLEEARSFCRLSPLFNTNVFIINFGSMS